jgi:hypothetical protein
LKSSCVWELSASASISATNPLVISAVFNIYLQWSGFFVLIQRQGKEDIREVGEERKKLYTAERNPPVLVLLNILPE